MEWDLLQNLKTQKETELHCINQIIDNYQTVNLKFPVAAFGLFDQRLLHSCEAGIQPALITENSKPWMLLMNNLPVGKQAPIAAVDGSCLTNHIPLLHLLHHQNHALQRLQIQFHLRFGSCNFQCQALRGIQRVFQAVFPIL